MITYLIIAAVVLLIARYYYYFVIVPAILEKTTWYDTWLDLMVKAENLEYYELKRFIEEGINPFLKANKGTKDKLYLSHLTILSRKLFAIIKNKHQK